MTRSYVKSVAATGKRAVRSIPFADVRAMLQEPLNRHRRALAQQADADRSIGLHSIAGWSLNATRDRVVAKVWRTAHQDLFSARWTCFSAHHDKVRRRSLMKSRAKKNVRAIKN